MHADNRPLGSKAASLETKVAFLKDPASYPFPVRDIISRETHMSFVFLAGDKAFKLKKPVRFPYLDFSTLSRRETACRAELALNRRLASDVYLDVVALTRSNDGLAIGGPGEIIDWLIVMRRLDENETLENAILTRKLTRGNLDQLMTTLDRLLPPSSPHFRLTQYPRLELARESRSQQACPSQSRSWPPRGACAADRSSAAPISFATFGTYRRTSAQSPRRRRPRRSASRTHLADGFIENN